MRLIDADEFKRQIAGMAIVAVYSAQKANKRCELIDEQPTVYDVDKVVNQMEKVKTINVDVGFGTIYKAIRKDVAIEIVKTGGNINEQS